MKKKFFVVGACGAVRDIQRRVFVYSPAVLLRARHHAPQVLLPGLKSFPEILKLLFIHTNNLAATPARSSNLLVEVGPNKNDKRLNSDASTRPAGSTLDGELRSARQWLRQIGDRICHHRHGRRI